MHLNHASLLQLVPYRLDFAMFREFIRVIASKPISFMAIVCGGSRQNLHLVRVRTSYPLLCRYRLYLSHNTSPSASENALNLLHSAVSSSHPPTQPFAHVIENQLPTSSVPFQTIILYLPLNFEVAHWSRWHHGPAYCSSAPGLSSHHSRPQGLGNLVAPVSHWQNLNALK